MDILTIQQIVKNFGDDVIKQMQEELQKNNTIATSELMNSLNYRTQVSLERILIQFLSEDYGKYVETGRKAGFFPPVSKIEQWCQTKGIPKKRALSISWNIYRFGIKPKPFMFNSVTKKRQDFVQALLKVYGEEIIADIKKEFLEGRI